MVASGAGRSARRKATTRRRGAAALAVAVAGALAVVFVVVAEGATSHPGSGALPQGDDPVHLKPGDFSANIDNPQWPMTVGSRWVYRVIDTSDGSVKAPGDHRHHAHQADCGRHRSRVVRDIVTDHGQPVEVTKDWYAEDKHGNVWYFGEHTIEYVHGQPVDNGSWEAGVDGNLPGVALPAKPKVGLTYREEYSKGVAEDQSRVLALTHRPRSPPATTGPR